MFDVTSVAFTVDNLVSATAAFHSLSNTKETEFGKKQPKRSTLIPEVTPLTSPVQSSV